MSAPALQVQQQGLNSVSADNLNTYEQTCDSATELRTFVGVTGIQVYIRGISSPGDGGCGPFYWNPTSSGPDDGVNIIVPVGTAIGAWIRLTGVPAANAGGDLSGQYPNPLVVNSHFASPLPVNQGGTGVNDGSNLWMPGDYKNTARTTADPGWLLCFGQAVSRTTYAALFAVIGITFGAGDGSTTFNVPDKRGRVGAGLDNMGGVSAGRLTGAASGGVNANTMGATGGEQAHTPSLSEMPNHDHGIGGQHLYIPGSNLPGGQGPTYSQTVTASAAGGGQPFNVVQPTMADNVMIKT